jgi:hypothetical protein
VPQRHDVIDTRKRCSTNNVKSGIFHYELTVLMSRARNLSAVQKHSIAIVYTIIQCVQPRPDLSLLLHSKTSATLVLTASMCGALCMLP